MEIAARLVPGLRRVGETLALVFGEGPTQAAMRALLAGAAGSGQRGAEQAALFERIGWREYLETQDGRAIDAVELTGLWRNGAEYAGQGLAVAEPFDEPAPVEQRRTWIEDLVARGRIAMECSPTIFGDGHLHIWKGVAARAAIDFGGTVTAEGLQLLSGVSAAAVRNAVSLGELRPDADGGFAAEEAREWLGRRRNFCPSRWTNPSDGQEPFDASRIAEPDDNGMVQVPQDAEGTPFTPEHVVRAARDGPGLSVTIGAKGAEEQHRDFYEALAALAKMDVARWRRRNGVGNWGIVRARGAWVAVSKLEIDRQLAAKLAEAA